MPFAPHGVKGFDDDDLESRCSNNECDPVLLRLFGLIGLYCNGYAAVRLRYHFGLCSDIFITTDLMLAVLRFLHWLMDLPEY